MSLLQLVPMTISRWQWLRGPRHKTVSGEIRSPLARTAKARTLETALRIAQLTHNRVPESHMRGQRSIKQVRRPSIASSAATRTDATWRNCTSSGVKRAFAITFPPVSDFAAAQRRDYYCCILSREAAFFTSTPATSRQLGSFWHPLYRQRQMGMALKAPA